MGNVSESHFIAHLTWDEVARRIESGVPAIVPIGAAAKQHGFHLPLSTDRIQAEFLAERLATRIGALVWPTVSYGHYPAFVNYPGSTHLSSDLFEGMINEIAALALRQGCRAMLVLDTGISTTLWVDRALARLPTHAVLHLRIHEGRRYRNAAARLSEQDGGSHADELETSLLLAIAPEVVDMTRAEASPPGRRGVTGPLTYRDPASPNYSRSGSYGDPTLATQAKGDILLATMVDDLVEEATAFLAGLALRKT